MSLFSKLRKAPARPVVVVSGLPRSGTSMMMRMLEAGGLPVLTDRLRAADEDNPKGYYEFERVKQLDKGDHAWLPEAQGKAVKVISALLEHLPPDYPYRVIFVERRMEEVLASQKKMLARRGEPTDRVSDEEMARLFAKHLQKVKLWLSAQPNFRVLYVDYNRMVADPWPYVRQINQFLDGRLDEARMVEVVDPALYRNRAATP
ncbi:MAG: sulfotransferase domain-containing protein [Anaerolineae bacterium]|nr:sulfotransferase domain-containing protein [Anaerolineae bacterium]